MIRLNRTHSFLKLQAKFFKFTFCILAKFPANQAQFTPFAQKNPTNNATFALFIHPIYLFSDACPGRELSKIPVNRAEFTQFAHRLHE